MNDKEKLLKKTKLIFLAEFLIISVILFVVGFLRIFNVIDYSETRLLVYNIITLIGATYIYFDFFFNLLSKKRREKACFLDKGLSMIAATYLFIFDIMVLAKFLTNMEIVKYSVGAVILYAAATSLFLGIYHYFKPTKQTLEVVEEEYESRLLEIQEQESKDSKEDKQD